MKPHQQDDIELKHQLNQGNEEAFRVLYETYGKKLFYFARNLGLGTEDAKEIVQEVFARIWSNRQDIDMTYSLNAYVITIARNLIYNHLKGIAVRQRHLAEALQNKEDISVIRDHELRSLIDKAMDGMPEKRRQVFRLSRLEGYVNQQIADELGISKSTVENHLNKALKHMKKQLGQYGYYGCVAILYLFLN